MVEADSGNWRSSVQADVVADGKKRGIVKTVFFAGPLVEKAFYRVQGERGLKCSAFFQMEIDFDKDEVGISAIEEVQLDIVEEMATGNLVVSPDLIQHSADADDLRLAFGH